MSNHLSPSHPESRGAPFARRRVEAPSNSETARPTVCLIVTAEITALAFYRDYAVFLRDCGWRVILVSSTTGALEEFGRESRIQVISVPMVRDPSPCRDAVALCALVVAIHRIRPDAVVYATPKASLLGSIAAGLCRVPMRGYQLWGLRLETETGLRRAFLALCELAIGWISTQVVPNSQSLGVQSIKLGLAPRRKMVLLGRGSSHGVNLDKFNPAAAFPAIDRSTDKFLKQSGGPVMVFVGRITADKGIYTLLDALEIIQSRQIQIRTLIVGSTEDEELRRRIEARSASLTVHVVGPVEDTRPYYGAADWLCLPSKREGLPNVVLEAAAMAVPAIVSDSTGVRDAVVSGETGLIFPSGDCQALAEQIAIFAMDEPLRKRLGASAQAWVKENFRNSRVLSQQEKNLRIQTEQSRIRLRSI